MDVGVDRFGNPIKMKNRIGNTVDEIAVMVGHFDAIDSPDAQKVLLKVKTSYPDCLDVKKRKQTNQSLAQWRILQREFKRAIKSKKKAQRSSGSRVRNDQPAASQRVLCS